MNVAAVGAAASLSLADVDYVNVRGKTKEGSQFTFMGMLTLLLAGGSATFAVLSMVVIGSPLEIVAGIIALVTAPIALVQRFRLSRMDTLRQVHNSLRQDVGRISAENNELEGHMNRLSEKADRVKIVEANLQRKVESQGSTVNSVVKLVKDNGRILDDMNEMIVAQVAAQLMTTIVKADRDQDFQLSESEINELLYHVRAMKGVEHIDEQELRKVLSESNGVEGVFTVIQDMMKAGQQRHVGRLAKSTKSLIQVSSRSPKVQ